MFTGIIKNIGVIKDLKEKNNGYFLSVISDLSYTKRLSFPLKITHEKVKKYRKK